MQFWSVILITLVSIRSGKETTQKSAQARNRHRLALYSIVSVVEGGYILGSIARISCLRFMLKRPLLRAILVFLMKSRARATMSANAQHSSSKHRPQAAIGRSVGRHQHELKELSWQT
jgi:hypothetical protein